MSYYWAKQQTVNSDSNGSLTGASTSSLLTPAQVTVCSVRDKLVYNIEYKQAEETINKPLSRTSERRSRGSTVSSSSNTFAAANAVAARFQNHERNHTRRHTRKISSDSNVSDISNVSNLSTLSDISEDSMWEDWIVKFHKSNVTAADDAKMEDWIFETNQ
jgi:hypothetical protein